MTSFRHLTSRRDGPIERLVLNRPEVRNAFNEEMIAELAGWAASVPGGGARVAVLSGAGPVFCAGADLTWMARMVGDSREDNVRDATAMAAMFEALDTLPIPLIGRIHGAALGGGAGLAAVCDVVIAAADASFGFTEVKLGILPSVIAPFALAKIGLSAARELFLSGVRFSAARAWEIGLVHRVVPAADLDEAAAECAAEFLSAGPTAIAAAKSLVREIAGRPARDVASLTAETIAAQRVSPEGQEGMRAFLEKREPSWKKG